MKRTRRETRKRWRRLRVEWSIIRLRLARRRRPAAYRPRAVPDYSVDGALVLDQPSRVDVAAWRYVIGGACGSAPGDTPVLLRVKGTLVETGWSVHADDEDLIVALGSFEFDRPPIRPRVAA